MAFTQPPKHTGRYNTQHLHVREARGTARTYPCIDCGNTASQWSWRHGEDPENVNSYDPRCRRCHTVYDDLPARLAEARANGAYDNVAAWTIAAHTGAKRTDATREAIGAPLRGHKPVTNKSGVPGVIRYDNRWLVNVQHVYGGRFTDFGEAVAARNALALERYGPDAKLYNADGTLQGGE